MFLLLAKIIFSSPRCVLRANWTGNVVALVPRYSCAHGARVSPHRPTAIILRGGQSLMEKRETVQQIIGEDKMTDATPIYPPQSSAGIRCGAQILLGVESREMPHQPPRRWSRRWLSLPLGFLLMEYWLLSLAPAFFKYLWKVGR